MHFLFKNIIVILYKHLFYNYCQYVTIFFSISAMTVFDYVYKIVAISSPIFNGDDGLNG